MQIQMHVQNINRSNQIIIRILIPSPQGDFLVVMRRVLVGMRTGPLVLMGMGLCLALFMRSLQTNIAHNIENQNAQHIKLTIYSEKNKIKITIDNLSRGSSLSWRRV